MIETRNISEELLAKYLYGELDETSRGELEERFFEDEQLFANLLELENALVDRYASRKMPREELERFEKKYLTTAEKREKVANAAALQRFLSDKHNEKTAVDIVRAASLCARLQAFFAAPRAWQYATAAICVLFALSLGFFIFDGWRLREEIAGLKNGENQNANLSGTRERDLLNELGKIREREKELERELNEKTTRTENLNREREAELNRERSERERLEKELEKLRQKREKSSPERNADATLNPVLAVVLRPNGAGNNSSAAQTITVSRAAKKLNLTLTLPFKANAAESFSVDIDGREIAANLKPRAAANGSKRIRVQLSLQNLSGSEHRVIVRNASETVFETYVFRLKKQ